MNTPNEPQMDRSLSDDLRSTYRLAVALRTLGSIAEPLRRAADAIEERDRRIAELEAALRGVLTADLGEWSDAERRGWEALGETAP